MSEPTRYDVAACKRVPPLCKRVPPLCAAWTTDERGCPVLLWAGGQDEQDRLVGTPPGLAERLVSRARWREDWAGRRSVLVVEVAP